MTSIPVDYYKKTVQELAEGKRIIYVMTRLYDFSEKEKGSLLEDGVFRGIKMALEEMGFEFKYFSTFLPFRDTREDEIVSKDRTRIIYDADMERLNRLFAVVGSLDDPSKDEGICMEIGYAAGKKVPILAVVTDFIWYASRYTPGLEYILDPVLLRLIGKLLFINKLPPARVQHKSWLLKDMMKVKKDYFRRIKLSLNKVINEVSKEVYSMIKRPWDYVSEFSFKIPVERFSDTIGSRIYLEFGGGMYEWQREYMQRIKQRLLAQGNYEVLFSRRHDPEFQREMYERYGEKSLSVLGKTDIESAISSDIIVTCGDENEMNSGTAAIHGLSRALGKKVIMYYSGNMKIVGEGGHEMTKNLMLQYSSDRIVNSLFELLAVIKSIYRGSNLRE
jgi:nucleoside 2-deoxyribosyltransferase